MKSSAGAIFLVVYTLAITAGVVCTELKKGYYIPAQLGSVQQVAPGDLSPDSTYEVSAYPVPVLDLAPGEGRQDVQNYCNTCHSPRYIAMQPPLPAATWEAEVNKMNKAFGANIPDDSSRRIISYLQAHYTPETREQ